MKRKQAETFPLDDLYSVLSELPDGVMAEGREVKRVATITLRWRDGEWRFERPGMTTYYTAKQVAEAST
jgi:hypothetical protein